MTQSKDNWNMRAFENGREALWMGIVKALAPRIRLYVTTTHCSADETDELMWDVLAELACNEVEFIRNGCPWSDVLPIMRAICAKATRRWRRELPAACEACESQDIVVLDTREQYLSELTEWVTQNLLLLSPKQQEACRLRLLEGKSYAEAATEMRSSEGAIRFNVHAGLHRLRVIAGHSPPPRG